MVMNNKNEHQYWYDIGLLFYTLFAAFSVGTVSYLFYYEPVNYSFFVVEDRFAEYGTFVSFGLAGIVLLILSLMPGPGIRRVVCMIIGLTSLIIAAEEISWGQRVFNIETPAALGSENLQNEINFHNLVTFKSAALNLQDYAAFLTLGYLFISLAVLALKPRLAKTLTSIGIPIAPVRLFPVFLLAPYFFIFHPLARNGELGELFLGVTVLIWAVDLFTSAIETKQSSSFTPVLASTGILLLTGIIAAGLTYRYPGEVTGRLNLMASRDYYKRDMYEQAQAIYIYILNHPQYLMENTRINYAKTLQSAGEEAEATRILVEAATDLEAKILQEAPDKMRFRRLGIIYMMLSERKLAEDYFDKSVEIDQRKLSLNPTPDERAQLLLSISRTMEARGDIGSAINNVEQASKHVQSAALRFYLEERLETLVELQANSL